jgi:hypothetical protein
MAGNATFIGKSDVPNLIFTPAMPCKIRGSGFFILTLVARATVFGSLTAVAGRNAKPPNEPMTPDTITPAKVAALQDALYQASCEIDTLEWKIERGDVSPEVAADQINRMIEDLMNLGNE